MPTHLPELLALSLDLVAVFDRHHFSEVNDRWAPALGWTPEELVGRHFADLIHPDDLPATVAATMAALEDGKPTTDFVNRYRTKDGGYRWLLWETRPLDDGRWLCAARDITREREALIERERLVREHQALRRVATEVAAGRPGDVFATVAEEVGLLLEASAAAVLKARAKNRLELLGRWSREGDDRITQGAVVDLDESVDLPALFDAGVPVHQPSADDDPIARRFGYGASVTAPITIDGRFWGLLTATHTEPGGLARDVVERLDEFAALTAMAVANADARQELERRAVTDSLTSLLNHGAFHAVLEGEFARALVTTRPLALVLIDIDEFKSFNDRFGHRTGDEVLADVSARIAGATRPGDVVGRIGGDELALALPDCDAAGARHIVDRIREAVTGAPTAAGRVTLSAGVADSTGAARPEDLFARADRMLYLSKAGGRDRTSVDDGTGARVSGQ